MFVVLDFHSINDAFMFCSAWRMCQSGRRRVCGGSRHVSLAGRMYGADFSRMDRSLGMRAPAFGIRGQQECQGQGTSALNDLVWSSIMRVHDDTVSTCQYCFVSFLKDKWKLYFGSISCVQKAVHIFEAPAPVHVWRVCHHSFCV
jgi:hypothetical protein